MISYLVRKFDNWWLSQIDLRICIYDYGLVETREYTILIHFIDDTEYKDKIIIVDYPYWHWFYTISGSIYEIMRLTREHGVRTKNRIYPSHSIKFIELSGYEVVQSVWLQRPPDL